MNLNSRGFMKHIVRVYMNFGFFFVEKHNSADDPARVDEKFMRIIKLVPTRAHPELRKHQTIVETFQMRL